MHATHFAVSVGTFSEVVPGNLFGGDDCRYRVPVAHWFSHCHYVWLDTCHMRRRGEEGGEEYIHA